MRKYRYYDFVIDTLCELMELDRQIRECYFNTETLLSGVGAYSLDEESRIKLMEMILCKIYMEGYTHSKYKPHELIMFSFIILFKSNI